MMVIDAVVGRGVGMLSVQVIPSVPYTIVDTIRYKMAAFNQKSVVIQSQPTLINNKERPARNVFEYA